jgi:hypothetical protein
MTMATIKIAYTGRTGFVDQTFDTIDAAMRYCSKNVSGIDWAYSVDQRSFLIENGELTWVDIQDQLDCDDDDDDFFELGLTDIMIG